MSGYLHFNYGDSRRCNSSDLGVDCYFYKMVFPDGREEKWEWLEELESRPVLHHWFLRFCEQLAWPSG